MYAGTLLDIAMTHADNMIVRAKDGDRSACDKLVRLWYKRIYNFAFKYLGDHDKATEVTQKSFISMYKNIRKLEDTARFRPWLYRIASNYCHEEYRKENRESRLFINKREEDVNEDEKYIGEAPGVEKIMHTKDLNSIIQWALNKLTEEQREVIIMKEYEGLKFREIADALEVSENTVKSRLYYALAHLKKLMEDNNWTKENLYYEG